MTFFWCSVFFIFPSLEKWNFPIANVGAGFLFARLFVDCQSLRWLTDKSTDSDNIIQMPSTHQALQVKPCNICLFHGCRIPFQHEIFIIFPLTKINCYFLLHTVIETNKPTTMNKKKNPTVTTKFSTKQTNNRNVNELILAWVCGVEKWFQNW